MTQTLLRLLTWRVRCWLRMHALVSLPSFGVRMYLLPYWQGAAKYIYVYRENYERELRYFYSALQPGDVVVDVGAFYGIYTLVAASRVGPDGHVLAFEPAAEAFGVLRRNITLNGYHWVRAFQFALADREGEAFFYQHADPSRNSLGPTSGTASRVALHTLDDVLDLTGIAEKVTAIKIDVEGADALVLHGARRTMARFRPLVIFEVNRSASHRLGVDPNEAWTLLDSLGYRFFRVGESGSLRPLQALPPGGNVVALHDAGALP